MTSRSGYIKLIELVSFVLYAVKAFKVQLRKVIRLEMKENKKKILLN